MGGGLCRKDKGSPEIVGGEANAPVPAPNAPNAALAPVLCSGADQSQKPASVPLVLSSGTSTSAPLLPQVSEQDSEQCVTDAGQRQAVAQDSDAQRTAETSTIVPSNTGVAELGATDDACSAAGGVLDRTIGGGSGSTTACSPDVDIGMRSEREDSGDVDVAENIASATPSSQIQSGPTIRSVASNERHGASGSEALPDQCEARRQTGQQNRKVTSETSKWDDWDDEDEDEDEDNDGGDGINGGGIGGGGGGGSSGSSGGASVAIENEKTKTGTTCEQVVTAVDTLDARIPTSRLRASSSSDDLILEGSSGTTPKMLCTKCDHTIQAFDGYLWADNANYLFFRNFGGVAERLRENLVASPAHKAYACQCAWQSIAKAKNLSSWGTVAAPEGNSASDGKIFWVLC